MEAFANIRRRAAPPWQRRNWSLIRTRRYAQTESPTKKLSAVAVLRHLGRSPASFERNATRIAGGQTERHPRIHPSN